MERPRPARRRGKGSANALAQAFEIVATPLLFALLGLWLDGRFGTGPVFTIVFGLLGVVGSRVRTYYWYQAQMDARRGGEAVDDEP